jgi:hypothetical protein
MLISLSCGLQRHNDGNAIDVHRLDEACRRFHREQTVGNYTFSTKSSTKLFSEQSVQQPWRVTNNNWLRQTKSPKVSSPTWRHHQLPVVQSKILTLDM